MLSMLIAYNAAMDVVATRNYQVIYDDVGDPLGMVDFIAHEEAGGEHTDIWTAGDAVGSKAWPEWIGGAAHQFRVELEGPPGGKRIRALVHKVSGHRRERASIEAAIRARILEADGKAADIRDLVGGPNRPLLLDEGGRTMARPEGPPRPKLPLIGIR